jgi:hypothetical protein
MRSTTRALAAAASALLSFAAIGGCNADLANLDPCHELSQALCSRVQRCQPSSYKGSCADDLEKQCINVNHSGDQSNADSCSGDLGGACTPDLPPSCSDLEAALGCNSCPSTTPTEAAREACCQVNYYSAVCLGCN